MQEVIIIKNRNNKRKKIKIFYINYIKKKIKKLNNNNILKGKWVKNNL